MPLATFTIDLQATPDHARQAGRQQVHARVHPALEARGRAEEHEPSEGHARNLAGPGCRLGGDVTGEDPPGHGQHDDDEGGAGQHLLGHVEGGRPRSLGRGVVEHRCYLAMMAWICSCSPGVQFGKAL